MRRNFFLSGLLMIFTWIVFAAWGEAPFFKLSTEVFAGNLIKPNENNPIQIVQPAENARLPFLRETFVCGSVAIPGRLFINGTEVPIYPGGGFVTMVNLTPGKFAIKAKLLTGAKTYEFDRKIEIAEPERKAPVSPLTIEWVTPREDHQLLPGDYLMVSCKGSPGMKGYFTITWMKKNFPMVETASSGIYRGGFRIPSSGLPGEATIRVFLVNSKKEEVFKEAQGKLRIFPNDIPVMAEVAKSGTILHSGPAIGLGEKAGYEMFPPVGTVLQLTGKIGNEYRVRLNESKTVWVNTNAVKLLAEGTPAALTVIGNLSVRRVNGVPLIRIPMNRKLPFRIDADPEENFLDISIYGAFSNTDRIANVDNTVVKQVSWFQDNEETYRLRVKTFPNSWWGYEADYVGNQLVIKLKTPPAIGNNDSPLAGLTIAVDAGHGKGSGAIGCTGYAEGDANLAMALNLNEKLLAEGAKVILTRPGAEDIPLSDRPEIASKNKADILLSLHNNSLGYGGNPLLRHGFEIYYFTPMSLPLAREIHDAYREAFGSGSEFTLPDGGLYYGNLALTRSPQMPSVLIETGYMIFPPEETYLKNDKFRSVCSEAIIKALKRYARRMRSDFGKTIGGGIDSKIE